VPLKFAPSVIMSSSASARASADDSPTIPNELIDQIFNDYLFTSCKQVIKFASINARFRAYAQNHTNDLYDRLASQNPVAFPPRNNDYNVSWDDLVATCIGDTARKTANYAERHRIQHCSYPRFTFPTASLSNPHDAANYGRGVRRINDIMHNVEGDVFNLLPTPSNDYPESPLAAKGPRVYDAFDDAHPVLLVDHWWSKNNVVADDAIEAILHLSKKDDTWHREIEKIKHDASFAHDCNE
jgi:hypothetical protein